MATRRRLPLAVAPVDPTTHEWVSFVDDDGDTYLFDVTFLTSNWACIFGAGCLGVLTGPAPELVQGCCSYGAHLQDADDERKVRRYARRLRADQWQYKAFAATQGGAITVDDEGATVTRLADGACIFLNRPGFAAGAGCALHTAALAAGARPLDWKPNVCWQVPLRLEADEQTNGTTVFTLREWGRRDWGEGGSEFHWWCTDDPLAFVDRSPVYRTLADEIAELVGDDMYARLAAYLDARGPRAGVPHPALRRASARADG